MATLTPADDRRTAPAAARDGRVRHPAALIRAAVGLAAVGLLLLLVQYAQGTAGGLDADLAEGTGLLPRPPVRLAAACSAAALLTVPLAFAVDRLLRRAGRQVADGVLAAVLAYTLSVGLDLAFGGLTALTHPSPGGFGRTDPVYGHLAPVLAFMTAVGTAGLPRWRTALAACLATAGFTGLLTGYATPLSVLLALLVGWTAAQTVCWAVGEPTREPTELQLWAALHGAGARPDTLRRLDPCRYLVTQADGRPDLDVRVLDRRARATGLPHHLWQLLRLRTAPRPLGLRSLREGLEHQTLLAHAAAAAGVRTPEPLIAAELSPDAALVAYRHLPGRPLHALAPEELTDAVLTDAWEQLRLLQRRSIAHRSLSPAAVQLGPDGAVHLVGFAAGEIAAGELPLRLDVAGLLTVLALSAGAPRAVDTAVAVLGTDPVAGALPLLQPIALPRATREALAEQPELAAGIRAEVLRRSPRAEVEPVRLERLRPRTLATVAAGIAGGYLLLQSLFGSGTQSLDALSTADPFWLVLALLAYAASHLAATVGFVGFVPERISFPRALAAQVAGSFVKLVSPGGVGGVALNTRFLQSSGIPTAQALSSVGASQLLGLVLHMLQLACFTTALGIGPRTDALLEPVWLAVGAGAVAVLLATALAVPWLRHRIVGLLRPLRAEVLPRLLDLLQQPRKLAAGVAGQLLVSVSLVACLYCCALAVGARPDFSAVAVVFLAGNAAGSAAPTPGGVGLVESLLITGLASTGGMDEGAALAAVLLFRLLTFLLPVLPGWAAFGWLQRRRAL
ncbi:lysylphosphatidylglycerol synthase domain-containing protein [Kitasatospora sp. NPDC059571]|uniref:lysylphosphatidylglycerol synthase domain-containing protein n=1 Tax=Kitasatospora sp. NPDC059571 TaxID=3346871 RepID=UPI00367E5D19